MVCEHEYMNMCPPPIIELATGLYTLFYSQKIVFGSCYFKLSSGVSKPVNTEIQTHTFFTYIYLTFEYRQCQILYSVYLFVRVRISSNLLNRYDQLRRSGCVCLRQR